METCLASLNNGKHCIVYSSVLGALTGILSLLRPEDHVICGDDVYGETSRFFQKCAGPKQTIVVTFADVCDTDNFLSAIKSNTKVDPFQFISKFTLYS